MKGTIIINEIIFDIIDIRLKDGKMIFLVMTEGSISEFIGGETVLFINDEDGLPIASVKKTVETWQVDNSGDRIWVYLPMEIGATIERG